MIACIQSVIAFLHVLHLHLLLISNIVQCPSAFNLKLCKLTTL